MRLLPEGITVTELAPGVDLRRDVLEQSAIELLVADGPAPMDPALFRPEPMGLRLEECATMSELRLEREGPLAIVTLMRAAKLNALTRAMLDGLLARGGRAGARRGLPRGDPDRRRAPRPSAPVPTSPNGVRSGRWSSGAAGSARGTACSTAGRGCASR